MLTIDAAAWMSDIAVLYLGAVCVIAVVAFMLGALFGGDDDGR